MTPEIIESTFSYLIKKEKSEKKSRYSKESKSSFFQDLYELYERANNEFISDTIICTIYSYVREFTLSFEEIMENPKYIQFFLGKDDFIAEYNKKHTQETNQIKDMLAVTSLDISRYSNMSEIISYCLIEAYKEYNESSSYFVEKNDGKESSPYLHHIVHTNKSVNNHAEAISYVTELNYGLYVFKTSIYQQTGSTVSHNDILLVLNQFDGISVLTTNSRSFEGSSSLSVNNIPRVEHLLNKDHFNNISLTTTFFSKDPDEYAPIPFVNNVILNLFLMFFINDYHNVNKNVRKLTVNSKSEKLNIVPFQGLKTEQYQDITFDEIAFKGGKYDFLAPLDDFFQEYTDMNIVNYKDTDEEISFIPFNQKLVFGKEDLANVSVDKKGINQITETDLQFYIKPISEVSSLSKSERIVIAKRNKLTLYSVYYRAFITTYHEKIISEIKALLHRNLFDLLTDKKFLELSGELIFCKFNDKNRYNLYQGADTVISDIKHNFSISENRIENKTDFQSKAKPVDILSFEINNAKSISYLFEKYNSEMSDETLFFTRYFNASEQLFTMNQGLIKENFFQSLSLIDDELHCWYENSNSLYFTLPLSLKSKNQIVNLLEKECLEKTRNTLFIEGTCFTCR